MNRRPDPWPQDTMIKIMHITTDEEFNRLGQEWNPLLRRSPVDDIFLTWEWIHTWWTHYGHLYRPSLLAAYEADQLVGIAPLMLETQTVLGWKVRVLRNIGKPSPDVAGLIVPGGRDDVLKAFALWLVENQDQWDVLTIREIPPEGMNVAAWSAHFPRQAFAVDVDQSRHFYIPMEGNWEQYHQGLSKNVRRNVKRRIKRLENKLGYRYAHKIGRETGLQDMEAVFTINRNARYPYLYRSPTEQAYHRELAGLMAERGWLDMHFLYVGDTPVAFDYGFQYDHKFDSWRSGFDRGYYQYSAGTILFFLMIQDGFKNGLKSLDFLLGDEDYKLDWKVSTRLFSSLQVVRKAPLPLFVYSFFPRFKRSVRDFLRRHEILHPLLGWMEQLVVAYQNRGIS